MHVQVNVPYSTRPAIRENPAQILVRDVSKSYSGIRVLDGVSLEIEKGEFVVLIGPSGGGKTTLLKLLNKLILPDSGSIYLDGHLTAPVSGDKLRRGIGYVIQGGGLFPHMTVADNISIMMKVKGASVADIDDRVRAMLSMVDLPMSVMDEYPCQLSGGQQQRVGVARAFATDPSIILMDEPFSALDPLTRQDLQDQILALHRQSGKTIVFVTHDMDEAIKLADRIAIIQHGKVIQYDTPANILATPASDFVTRFIGRAQRVSATLEAGRQQMEEGGAS
ncbi:glycine betaine/L-proline ABC transporter ATP-binding protein [Bifidobacterium lemurum]|uniref:ABC-type quaternary amine transporter n=1 Tax=Bifidobacterium lemurum TaxID=1603886 RepID=A0A261FU02_9BIFI|nr:ABC transporter ATP-binding protein [Bifidobacterium lemurum]OZG62664.1 glycine betaine/L-proline ABC transporter ATP-binding protein [Bifidobacterium lemurum]QOL34614.1 ABC transporter ATP-binding protein [Bifidobacterium lemurum]